MSDSDPAGIFLAISGTRGDRLLFRYPYETEDSEETICQAPKKTPYAVRIEEDYALHRNSPPVSFNNGTLVGYSDKVLAHLLAVKSGLCGQRFEVKIDDLLLVGFPMLLQHDSPVTTPSAKREMSTTLSFILAFALQANADVYAVQSYQDLVKQLSTALKHEEKRCGYFSEQKSIMFTIHDEVAALPEDSSESPYRRVLRECELAKQLKKIYDDLCTKGAVHLHINKWVQINFCLPRIMRSAQQANTPINRVKPEIINRCLNALRPYHAMLLLVDEATLLDSLPPDCSPSLTRLIHVASPLKSLQMLANDADICLGQIQKLVSHLVYWGKAIIIYPLCETNVYVLAPNASTVMNSPLAEEFKEQFRGMHLPAMLSEFSLPTPLSEHRNVLELPQQQTQQVQIVVWLLRHCLLVQMHTYVYLMPRSGGATSISSSTNSNSSWTGTRQRTTSLQLLSPTGEDIPGGFKRMVSNSDTLSVCSDESQSLGTSATSPATDSEQWRLQDTLLASMSAAEKQEIMSVPAANNSEDLHLFARLCPYFNGHHHLEEIMFYENLQRSQLYMLLDKFRDVLITCQHEDPGIAIAMHLDR